MYVRVHSINPRCGHLHHGGCYHVPMFRDGDLRHAGNCVRKSENSRDLWCRVCDRAQGDHTRKSQSCVASRLNQNRNH